MRRGALAVGRAAVAVPLMIAVVASATGWLYAIGPRATLPGPRVGDGLPLDELSKRASVPLLAFLGRLGARRRCFSGCSHASRASSG